MTTTNNPPRPDTAAPFDRAGYTRRRLLVGAALGAVVAGTGAGVHSVARRSAVDTTAPPSPTPTPATTIPVPSPTTTVPPTATSSTNAATTTNPNKITGPLQVGDSETPVTALQDRLRELGFEPGPTDGQFGSLTQQAVGAFEKLILEAPSDQATGVVTDELRQAMLAQSPIRPRRSFAAGETSEDHTEVYLPEQVVAFFVNDEAVLISHMSSGSGERWRETVTIGPGEYRNEDGTEPIRLGLIGQSVTPGGVYMYDRIVDGRRLGALGAMYDPAYFNFGIAIHGADYIPLHPASHGCIRLPRYISDRFQQFIDRGDQVWVWDGENQPEWLGQVPPPFDQIDPNWNG